MTERARLSEVVDLNPRSNGVAGLPGHTPVSFVPMASVSEISGTVAREETRPLSEVVKGFTYFQDGDILVAKITPCFENGKIALARIRNKHGFGSTEFHVFRAKLDRLDRGYLYHFLRQDRLRVAGARRMAGSAGQQRVPKGFFENLEIRLPALAEQRRIAEVLDKADALRAKRREAIAKLNDLLDAIFIEMFGDERVNPVDWPLKTLKELLEFRTGKLDSNAAVAGGRYPFFTCSREDFRIDTYAFDCEALLLSGNNAAAEYSVKHYKGKFNAYQRTYVISVRDPNHSYAYMKAVLKNKLGELKRVSKGTNTKYLTLAILHDLKAQSPPPELQRRFDMTCAAHQRLIDQNERSLKRLDQLFETLQMRAFTGTIFSNAIETEEARNELELQLSKP